MHLRNALARGGSRNPWHMRRSGRWYENIDPCERAAGNPVTGRTGPMINTAGPANLESTHSIVKVFVDYIHNTLRASSFKYEHYSMRILRQFVPRLRSRIRERRSRWFSLVVWYKVLYAIYTGAGGVESSFGNLYRQHPQCGLSSRYHTNAKIDTQRVAKSSDTNWSHPYYKLSRICFFHVFYFISSLSQTYIHCAYWFPTMSGVPFRPFRMLPVRIHVGDLWNSLPVLLQLTGACILTTNTVSSPVWR